MNDKPHTHEPELTRVYPLSQAGDWLVRYGTTTVKLASERDDPTRWDEPTRRKRVSAAIVEAVRIHDAASVGSGQLQEILRDAADQLKPATGEAPSWGSIVLEKLRLK
jgi:hypothetical protein